MGGRIQRPAMGGRIQRAATGGRIQRAATGGRPYGADDSVDVVGHDHKSIGFDAGIFVWYFIPYRLHHFSGIIENHFSVNDITEQTYSVLHTDGHEIGPGLRIIKPF